MGRRGFPVAALVFMRGPKMANRGAGTTGEERDEHVRRAIARVAWKAGGDVMPPVPGETAELGQERCCTCIFIGCCGVLVLAALVFAVVLLRMGVHPGGNAQGNSTAV